MLTPNFHPFPVLTTERLTLGRITEADAGELFYLRSHEGVMRYIDRPRPASIQEVLDFIRILDDRLIANDGINWGISLTSEKKLIGTIGFWRLEKEHYRAEIGYMLHPDMQGKGIMQEAMTAAIHYGFYTMKLHSIEANVNPENAASMKILERNGFIKEAHFKENYYYNGRFMDSLIYSLLTPLR